MTASVTRPSIIQLNRYLSDFQLMKLGKIGSCQNHGMGPIESPQFVIQTLQLLMFTFPQDKQITVHQARVKFCSSNFPAGFYWYGGKQQGVGKLVHWMEALLSDDQDNKWNQEEIDDHEEVQNAIESEDIIKDIQATSEEETIPDNATTRRRATPYKLRNKPHPSRKKQI